MQDHTYGEKCNRPIHVQGMLNARPHIWRKMQQTYSCSGYVKRKTTRMAKNATDLFGADDSKVDQGAVSKGR